MFCLCAFVYFVYVSLSVLFVRVFMFCLCKLVYFVYVSLFNVFM